MKYLTRLLCVAILIWAIFSFSSRPEKLAPKSPPLPPSPPTQREQISGQSPAPAKRKPASRLQELTEWIEEDRLCDGKGNFLRKNDLSESARIYEALEQAHGKRKPDPCLSAQLSPKKKQILHYADQSENESCQFLKALVLTGQMGLEEKSSPKEIEEGKSLLRELASAHPENGVYPFFLLGTERKPEHLSSFLRASQFRNPLPALTPRLREIGLTNSTALLFSIEAMATMKVPDYQSALKAAREMVAAPEYKGDYQSWLKSHLADLEEIRRLQLGEPYVWAIDLAILRSLALTGWEAHGKGPKPSLLEKEPWRALFRQVTNMEAYEPFYVNADQACERVQEAATYLLPDLAAMSDAMARRWAQYR
jgi:hypothetical protein